MGEENVGKSSSGRKSDLEVGPWCPSARPQWCWGAGGGCLCHAASDLPLSHKAGFLSLKILSNFLKDS